MTDLPIRRFLSENGSTKVVAGVRLPVAGVARDAGLEVEQVRRGNWRRALARTAGRPPYYTPSVLILALLQERSYFYL